MWFRKYTNQERINDFVLKPTENITKNLYNITKKYEKSYNQIIHHKTCE